MRTQGVTFASHVAASNVYLAGQRVPAGTYDQIEGGREARLENSEVLPATCDGHVAIYFRCLE